MQNKKLILAGGTGFLGQAICVAFPHHSIVVLCRNPKQDHANIRYVKWDGRSLDDWSHELENSVVVINLTGRSVDCRYNEVNRKEILESRTNATSIIGKAIQGCANPPELWINSASATIYRDAIVRPMDEFTGEIGDGFSVDVCKKWEASFNEVETPRTRKVVLRLAMVLGKKAGVMPVMIRLARLGLGGKQGKGDQYMSWIHEFDFVNTIKWIIEHSEISGTYNCCAPNPIPNSEFMRLLRKACKVPIGIPSTEWMLEIGAWIINTETELILKSRRVVPIKLLKTGFQFKYPEVGSAINNIVIP